MFSIIGAGEASADVPEGEEEKHKENNSTVEGKFINNFTRFIYLFNQTFR